MTEYQKNMRKLTIGFLLSLVITLGSYLLVRQHLNGMHQTLSHNTIFVLLTFFAASQCIIQAIFFLHIKDDPGHYRKVSGTLALVLIFFLVIASLWIMNNLDYNMTPREYEDTIQQEEIITPHHHHE